DGVPARCEPAAHPAGAAAGIEDPGSALRHRVEEAGLPVDVLAGGLDAPPALRIALRVVRVPLERLGPQVPVALRLSGAVARGPLPRRADGDPRHPSVPIDEQ